MRVINNDRKVSGFPQINDPMIIEEAISERRKHFRKVLIQSLEISTDKDEYTIISELVNKATEKGTKQAPILVDDLVDYYLVGRQESIIQCSGVIYSLISRVKDTVKNWSINIEKRSQLTEDIIPEIEQALSTWTDTVLPIRLSYKTRGFNYKLDKQILHDMGMLHVDIAVNLFNSRNLASIVVDLIYQYFEEYEDEIDQWYFDGDEEDEDGFSEEDKEDEECYVDDDEEEPIIEDLGPPQRGYGEYTWPNGETYTGEWEDGLEHGYGRKTWPDAKIYVGQWQFGERHGQGTLKFANGDKYVGLWHEDLEHGYGTYTWSDGTTYTGQWKAGDRDGYGTHEWSDGTTYTGQWKNDNMNGHGIYTLSDGSERTVRMVDDEIVNDEPGDDDPIF